MHTVHIQLSLDNKPICDGHSVKQIKKPFGFKGCRGIKKKKKKLGQFPEEAEQSQLCPQSSGHSSGQSRKAPSAGDLQGRNLAWPHLPLLCVRSSGSQRNLSFASRCSKLGQGQCSLLPSMLLVAEPASQHRAVARWEPSLR